MIVVFLLGCNENGKFKSDKCIFNMYFSFKTRVIANIDDGEI